MTEELKRTLAEGLAALGLTPPEGAVDKLALYCDLLLEKNQVYVPDGDFDFVLDWIKTRCVNAKK